MPQTGSSSTYSCRLQLNWNKSECPGLACLFVCFTGLSFPFLGRWHSTVLMYWDRLSDSKYQIFTEQPPQSNTWTKMWGWEWQGRPGDRGGVRSWLNCLLGQSAEGDTVTVASICPATAQTDRRQRSTEHPREPSGLQRKLLTRQLVWNLFASNQSSVVWHQAYAS